MKPILKVNDYKLAEFFTAKLNAITKTKVIIKQENEHSFILLVDESEWDICQKEVINIAREFQRHQIEEKNNNSAIWASNKTIPTHNNGQYKIKLGEFSIKNVISSYPITFIIFLMCILVYISSMLFKQQTFDLLSMNGFSFEEPSSWYKLISPAIIHLSITHICFNLFWWCWLGSRIEKTLGYLPLLSLFLLGSILPNFAQYHIYGPMFGGLSGVNYALLGFSWIVTLLKPQRYKCIIMDKGIFGISILWATLGLIGLMPGMANGAHIGGLLTGLAIGLYDIYVIKRN